MTLFKNRSFYRFLILCMSEIMFGEMHEKISRERQKLYWKS